MVEWSLAAILALVSRLHWVRYSYTSSWLDEWPLVRTLSASFSRPLAFAGFSSSFRRLIDLSKRYYSGGVHL